MTKSLALQPFYVGHSPSLTPRDLLFSSIPPNKTHSITAVTLTATGPQAINYFPGDLSPQRCLTAQGSNSCPAQHMDPRYLFFSKLAVEESG